MVTPETGTLIFNTKSDGTGQGFTASFYVSDVVGAFVTWNLNGVAVAGSQNFINVPFDCYLYDVSIATGNTVTVAGIVQLNDQNSGSVISWANQLNTLATRVHPNIPLKAGRKFAILQA
jgi:hypothetical protein